MPSDPVSPLTDQHLDQLNNALSAAQVAAAQIEMAKRAGIAPDQIAQLEQQNNANIDKIRTVKQVYFAGR